jgi:hypothetical protein
MERLAAEDPVDVDEPPEATIRRLREAGWSSSAAEALLALPRAGPGRRERRAEPGETVRVPHGRWAAKPLHMTGFGAHPLEQADRVEVAP